MDTIPLRVVARVANGRHDPADAGWGSVESAIVVTPGLEPALAGLDGWSHVLVVFFMDRDPDREPPCLARRPRGRDDMPELGVFAQRGRNRPNPLGVTAVPIVRVERDRVVVRGLDALDGTPVLDLKPYAPAFDRVDAPRVPEWFERLMRGYF